MAGLRHREIGEGNDRQPACRHRRQGRESARSRHRPHAEATRQRCTFIGPRGEHAGIGDRAPSDRQRRLAPIVSAPSQGLQRRIGGDIGALAGRADNGRRRRKQPEQVKRVVRGQLVEVQGTRDLARCIAVSMFSAVSAAAVPSTIVAAAWTTPRIDTPCLQLHRGRRQALGGRRHRPHERRPRAQRRKLGDTSAAPGVIQAAPPDQREVTERRARQASAPSQNRSRRGRR